MRLRNRSISVRDLFDMTARDFAELFYEFAELTRPEQNAMIRDEYYECAD